MASCPRSRRLGRNGILAGLRTRRAEAQQVRDLIAAAGDDPADFDELITELDDQIADTGIRGKAAPAEAARRHRGAGADAGARQDGRLTSTGCSFMLGMPTAIE
jgi:hypothetical protein